jgi:cell division protein FtsQ
MAGKLNMKRVRNVLVWATVLAGIGILWWMAIIRKSNAGVKSLVVDIELIGDNQKMISEQEIVKMTEQFLGGHADSAAIRKLDVRGLETFLNKDRRIEQADVYFDSNDNLRIRIRQRKPIMRVIDKSHTSYYLDADGNQIPAGIGGAVRVPLVTGNVETYYTGLFESEKPVRLKEVFEIMKYVQKDDFLSALIEQVHVEDITGDIIMVPKIGRERLVFGGAEGMEDKFDKLKIFYREGLPRLGWSKYKTLNLKYTDQVACTLR